MISWAILSGAFLGWNLGANDAGNIFGTAVTTKVINYKTAVSLIAIFVIIGAYIDGGKGVSKLSEYAYNGGVNTPMIAFLVMLAAGITVFCMTMLRIPVSSSQAVIGSIMGAGLLVGKMDFFHSVKFFYAWVITPVAAMSISYILYKIFRIFIENNIKNIIYYDRFIKIGFILAGIFSAYSLGANNVANVTSIYAGKLNLITKEQAVLIGGFSIALGVIMFSKRVMKTIGKGLVPMSPVSGLISVAAGAITVYVFALIGIPVSTSQAIVGAVIGIGIEKGMRAIELRAIGNVLIAWTVTPLIAGLLSYIFIMIV